MANEQNLTGKGFDELTAEEQRKIAKQGGIASGKARREKANLRRMCQMVLEMDIKGKDGTMKSGAEAITLVQLQKALKGDAKAYEILRDTAGQKPVEKVMVAEVEQSVIDDVEKAVLNDTDTGD